MARVFLVLAAAMLLASPVLASNRKLAQDGRFGQNSTIFPTVSYAGKACAQPGCTSDCEILLVPFLADACFACDTGRNFEERVTFNFILRTVNCVCKTGFTLVGGACECQLPRVLSDGNCVTPVGVILPPSTEPESDPEINVGANPGGVNAGVDFGNFFGNLFSPITNLFGR